MQFSNGCTLFQHVNNCLVLSEERRFQFLFSFTVSADCCNESAGFDIALLEKETRRGCAGDADVTALHCLFAVADNLHPYPQRGGYFIRKTLGLSAVNVICKDLFQREKLCESLN